jgi:hypothetical protein
MNGGSIQSAKALQVAKIKEIARAVREAGLAKVDDQALALGVDRSTVWTILRGDYKGSGISAKTINRMLTSPYLPRGVRVALLEYIEDKAAGRYGHGKSECRKFRMKLSRRHQ